MQETQESQVQFLGQEDPLGKEMQPTPVFLPGKSHGQRSLAGYSPRGCRRVRHDSKANNKGDFAEIHGETERYKLSEASVYHFWSKTDLLNYLWWIHFDIWQN